METRDAADNATTTMTTTTTDSSAPLLRPAFKRAPASNPDLPSLPPLITTPATYHQRIPSNYSNKHLSTFSTSSLATSLSRPQSNVFPYFLSSLPYALVRDFAYPSHIPLHYGPLPDQLSQVSTPASEINRRVSDPHGTLRVNNLRGSNDGSYFGMQLPARSFADGPPYAEDADLLSPIVTSTKHKKTKSNVTDYMSIDRRWRDQDYVGAAREPQDMPQAYDDSSAHMADVPDDGTQMLPPSSHQQQTWRRRQFDDAHAFDPNVAPDLHASSISDDYSPSEPADDAFDDTDESRLSRAYQFTIASPDEEFHGKAVALFDFVRENDNELPFFEGQILWVSYRHGEGWLVAQDPKSGESGLIPEEYVRLERDIEGGLSGLKAADFPELEVDDDSPVELRRPEFHNRPTSLDTRAPMINGEHYATPVLSHFTTSSKDLEPVSLSPAAQQQQQQSQHSQFLSSQQTTPIAVSRPTMEGNQLSQTAEAPHGYRGGDGGGGGGVLLGPDTFTPQDAAAIVIPTQVEDAQAQDLPHHAPRETSQQDWSKSNTTDTDDSAVVVPRPPPPQALA